MGGAFWRTERRSRTARARTYRGRALGRKAGVKALTREKLQEFEALGAKCWQEIEALRMEWGERLGVLTRNVRPYKSWLWKGNSGAQN